MFGARERSGSDTLMSSHPSAASAVHSSAQPYMSESGVLIMLSTRTGEPPPIESPFITVVCCFHRSPASLSYKEPYYVFSGDEYDEGDEDHESAVVDHGLRFWGGLSSLRHLCQYKYDPSPSRAGNGRRFSSPRWRFITPRNAINDHNPCLKASPAITAIPTGPTTSDCTFLVSHHPKSSEYICSHLP